jgi:outer membrane lipoprotein SlyB
MRLVATKRRLARSMKARGNLQAPNEEISMMDAMTNNTSNPANTATTSAMAAFSRPAALAGGALALILATAFATTLVVRSGKSPASSGTDTAAAAMATSPMALLSAQSGSKTGTPQAPMDMPEQATKLPTITEKAQSPAKAPSPQPHHSARPAPQRSAATGTTTTASVCTTCGVVQSVTPVDQKGEGTGVGAVGGAVVGGLLGNQVGGGNGKKAMTVIGAVGGGMAGHEIEKRARGATVYRVNVLMNDGSTRTVTQSTPPTVGQKVTVSGNQIRG